MWPLCGLDVEKRSISACIRISEPEERHTVTATFRTFTEDCTVYATGSKSTR
jgi:hypothetical protein